MSAEQRKSRDSVLRTPHLSWGNAIMASQISNGKVPTLVVQQLTGASDYLNTVVPYANPLYCDGRPALCGRAIGTGGRQSHARSWPAGNAVDLDPGITGKVGDSDAGAGRSPVWRKVAGVYYVHGCIVLPEMGQEDPDTDHGVQT